MPAKGLALYHFLPLVDDPLSAGAARRWQPGRETKDSNGRSRKPWRDHPPPLGGDGRPDYCVFGGNVILSIQ
jgi:hypothetical protein